MGMSGIMSRIGIRKERIRKFIKGDDKEMQGGRGKGEEKTERKGRD